MHLPHGNVKVCMIQVDAEKADGGFSRGGHSNGKRGYQARPWTHKKHPNHVFFRYENRP